MNPVVLIILIVQIYEVIIDVLAWRPVQACFDRSVKAFIGTTGVPICDAAALYAVFCIIRWFLEP